MKKLFLILLILSIFVFLSCDSGDKGTLKFIANGEDFVKQGFIDKDGWDISFEHVYINLCDVKAYSENNETVALNKDYFIDLKKVGEFESKSALPTEYQGIGFSLKKAKSGEYKEYSIVMIGTAKKNNEKIDFTIKIDEELKWDCPDGYVGDEIKGIVEKEKEADVEATFHFDHIFGDIEADADDHINTESVGFDYFALFVENGKLDITQKDLLNKTNKTMYDKFVKSLSTLGHVGEGHCHIK